MQDIHELIETIQAEQKNFSKRVESIPASNACRKIESFMNNIEEPWREIHILALTGKHVEQITSFSEDIARYILGFIEKESINHCMAK